MEPTAIDFPLEHQTVATNGLQLHVVTAGPADGRPLVLLHGFPEFWYGWHRQIGPFARAGYRVIVPDLRGYNLSDKPSGSRHYTADVVQGDILGLLDHFGIARVDLVGHDWGGLLAWWLASYHPDRLRRLAVLNTPHPQAFRQYFMRHPTQQLRTSYLMLFQVPLAPELLLKTGDYFWLRQGMLRTSRPGTFSDEDMARYRTAWSQPGALEGMLGWYRALRRAPAAATPTDPVTVPTLLIWGERDFALSRDLAPLSIERCTDGRLERLADAGHWLQHEVPNGVNTLLLDYLGG